MHSYKVGDRVKHASHVIERKRDYWNSCGREPMKSGAHKALDDAIAARGTITELLLTNTAIGSGNGYAVTWDNGSLSRCLTYMVTLAND